MMQYRFHHIDEAPRDRVEEQVRRKARRVEARLKTFEDDLITLDTRISRRDKRYGHRRQASLFESRLVLHLAGQKLPDIAADGHGETWKTAINDAFTDLERQLEKLLADLHRQPDIQAFRRRPSWEREGAELLANPKGEPKDDETWMEEWDRENRG